jgi:single-strand DNA-binding protein
MNSVNLIGRLTRDPELRTADETSVGNMRVAVQRPKRDGADYVDVTVFGRQAEVCAGYLTKGRRVAVTGRLRHSEWQAQDGSRRQRLEVVADQVDFLDRPRTEQPSGEDEAESQPDLAAVAES